MCRTATPPAVTSSSGQRQGELTLPTMTSRIQGSFLWGVLRFWKAVGIPFCLEWFLEKLALMGRIERNREIARRRARTAKVKQLRAMYAAAKTDAEKEQLREKLHRVSPFAKFEEAAS